MKKAYLKTYGCQMNEQDSSQMQSLLSQAGFARAHDEFDADLILINTCSIREKVVHKVYSDLGRVREIKLSRPDVMVGIAGCVSETDKETLVRRFPFLDLVFGPDHIRRLPEMIQKVEGRRKSAQQDFAGDDWMKNTLVRTGFDLRQDFKFVNLLPSEEESAVKAFVNIQKGCDNICSFCVVPFVRGREVSRPADEIVAEVAELVRRGVKEVTLLGQNVNSYGMKNTGGITFAKLLRHVVDETGIQRLRFTSSHPKDVGEDLIREFAENSALCPMFHLPVQSGSDAVLRAMRRQYTRRDYLHIVNRLREVVPQMRFSTDMIVGFPGETRQDFEQTLSLMREVGFDFIFSFMYSPRPYTTAIKLEDDVPESEKLARLEELQLLERELALRGNETCVGTVQDVLVESVDDESVPPFCGRSPANKIVHFHAVRADNRSIATGDVVPVRITRGNTRSLMGEAA